MTGLLVQVTRLSNLKLANDVLITLANGILSTSSLHNPSQHRSSHYWEYWMRAKLLVPCWNLISSKGNKVVVSCLNIIIKSFEHPLTLSVMYTFFKSRQLNLSCNVTGRYWGHADRCWLFYTSQFWCFQCSWILWGPSPSGLSWGLPHGVGRPGCHGHKIRF